MLQKTIDTVNKGTGKFHLIDARIDQHLARGYIDLVHQMEDLFPHLRRALHDESVVVGVGNDAGKALVHLAGAGKILACLIARGSGGCGTRDACGTRCGGRARCGAKGTGERRRKFGCAICAELVYRGVRRKRVAVAAPGTKAACTRTERIELAVVSLETLAGALERAAQAAPEATATVAAIKLCEHAADDFGSAVLELVNVIRDGADGETHGDVELGDPLFHLREDTGVGCDGEHQIDTVNGEEANGRGLVIQSVGAENGVELFDQLRGAAILRDEGLHALPGKGIGIEEIDQLRGALHVARVVFDHQQVGWKVADHGGALTQERFDDVLHFGRRHVLEEDEVQQGALIIGKLFHVHLRRDGQVRNFSGRRDAVKISHLHHGKAVHAEDGFKDGPHVFGADGAIGVDGNAAALDARIQNVIDVEISREDIDHLKQRRVGQIEPARHRGWRSSGHRRGGRRGLRQE